MYIRAVFRRIARTSSDDGRNFAESSVAERPGDGQSEASSGAALWRRTAGSGEGVFAKCVQLTAQTVPDADVEGRTRQGDRRERVKNTSRPASI